MLPPSLEIDWGRWLRPGDRVVCSHMSSQPRALQQSLLQHRPVMPLSVMLGVAFSPDMSEAPEGWQLQGLGAMGSGSVMASKRSFGLSTLTYSAYEQAYAQALWPVDVVLVSLSRDPQGRLYLGASHGAALAAARRARVVLAEVNAQAPCLLDSQWPADVAIHAQWETSYAPPELSASPAGAAEQTIGQHLAARIPDGACLQVGIGSLPSALLDCLSGHRRLGVHSGMYGQAMHRLLLSGAIDNSEKDIDAGLCIIGGVAGQSDFLAQTDRHPALRMRSPAYTHELLNIQGLRNFFSLNSALEVDLLGQVNAEAIVDEHGRWRYVGGIGGLPEFARAAMRAPGGQSAIALPARTPRGRSRIVAKLSGPATLAASDADLIATEHGVAEMRHASVDQRVMRMVAIADPLDRPALLAQARAIGWI
jgi:acyl-CoA hydrolase